MSIDDWDRREVCPDGACIGVIGADGLCKVCGRAAQNWGDERMRGMVDGDGDDVGDADEADDEEVDDQAEAGDEPDADVGDDVEWGKRKLCSDGNCVGVIGENGRCTVCGSPP